MNDNQRTKIGYLRRLLTEGKERYSKYGVPLGKRKLSANESEKVLNHIRFLTAHPNSSE